MNETSQNRIKTILSIVIVVAALGFTAWTLFGGSRESTIIVDETTNIITIEGMYGQEILVDSETEINLVNPLVITRRTNGSSLGNNKKGYFTLEGGLAVYLNLANADIDWIEIVNGDSYYYINYDDLDSTTDLYNLILSLQN